MIAVISCSHHERPLGSGWYQAGSYSFKPPRKALPFEIAWCEETTRRHAELVRQEFGIIVGGRVRYLWNLQELLDTQDQIRWDRGVFIPTDQNAPGSDILVDIQEATIYVVAGLKFEATSLAHGMTHITFGDELHVFGSRWATIDASSIALAFQIRAAR